MAAPEKSALEQVILAKTKEAMKAKDAVTRTVLRNISSEFKQKKIDERLDGLTEADEITILKRMIKQRKDSVEQFNLGGREDLSEKEIVEIAIIEQFLPQQLTEAQITAEVEAVIAKVGATTAKDMGKVMGGLGHIRANADMGLASKIVKSLLS